MSRIGIDEVGRGCWAGPLLVVAARFEGKMPEGLNDSKKLTATRRQQLESVLAGVCQIGEGWVSPEEIDELGLTQAMRLAVKRALEAIGADSDDEITMDGNINYCPEEYTRVSCVVRADGSVPEVSAASIIAKVRRDAYMAEQALIYPEYGYESHVGYGTAAHISALKTYGLTPMHRKSFKPVKIFLNI